jgi:predicted secreted protein
MRLLTVVVLVGVLLVAACMPKTEWPARSEVEVSCTDFYEDQHIFRTLEVEAGGTFTITLCSNRSTGSQWSEDPRIDIPDIVEQTDHEYISPSGDPPPPPGAPGLEVWSFKALKQGSATIYLEYGRPWENGGQGEWTCTVVAVVK